MGRRGLALRCGVKPRRSREVISVIMHVLDVGRRWIDCPAEYRPPATIYDRFNCWSKARSGSAPISTVPAIASPKK
ncbi:MAG: transposase [Acetobacteraceae bacterium]